MKNFIIILFLITANAQAHNNLFFPGDAYFSSSIDKYEFWRQLGGKNKKKELNLSYHRYSKSFMACGYAGCENAHIINIPESTYNNLKSTLSQFIKEDEEATKGLAKPIYPVLIYNKDFDFKKYPIALRFNENFEKVQTNLAKRFHVVDDRLDSKKLRKFDDKHAKEVRELDTKSIPKDLSPKMGVKKPVVLEGSKLVFVIVLGGKESDLLDHAERRSGREIVIIGDKIERIKY